MKRIVNLIMTIFIMVLVVVTASVIGKVDTNDVSGAQPTIDQYQYTAQPGDDPNPAPTHRPTRTPTPGLVDPVVYAPVVTTVAPCDWCEQSMRQANALETIAAAQATQAAK